MKSVVTIQTQNYLSKIFWNELGIVQAIGYYKILLILITGEMYTNAADAAMAAMKGRMANKYYALAEEAWVQVEEWSCDK